MPDTHDLGRLFTHSVPLVTGSPIVHQAFTAEYDDPCRHSPTIVIKTPLRREGRWHGIRKSWLSVQVKLPTGKPVEGMRWGIVVGWWRFSKELDEWSALLRAVRMGRTDGDEAVNFENPTSASIRRALKLISGRRVPADGDAGVDG
jgi:hypothetical protein